MAAFLHADRVKETSTTTGTGTYDLAGAVTGFRTFVAGVGTGNRCTYVAENGTDWEINEGVVTDATPDTLTRAKLLASSTGAAINWAAGTRNLFAVYPAAQQNPMTRYLSTRYTNATTTGTEVSQLSFDALEPGTYCIQWWLLYEAAATTSSIKFGVNVTNTVNEFVGYVWYPSAGVTAATGTMHDANNATSGQVWAYANTRTEATTAPNLGPWIATTNAAVPHLLHLETLVVLTAAGDIELWCASEVAAEISLEVGSSGICYRTN